ncbi:MAG TPA: GerMN domain-containing protein [Acidimicrobiales bacterium]|nr:GerMN domain-containing protein [Acidimicrobiales bacterium]
MRRGRLLAATASLAMALAAVSCGIPSATGPTPIAKGDLPSHLLNPATPSTVGSTVPPAVGVPESIFLVAPTQHVTAVTRPVTFPPNMSEIMGALLEGPSPVEAAAGLQSFLTGTKTQVSATVAGGIATVDFTANPIQALGPNQTLAIAQVVFTATEQPGVTGVVFQIAGQTIGVPTASGAQVTGPVDRTLYAPQAPLP